MDMAHALSQTCRYTGHYREFYSVAQHSVHVAQELIAAGNSPEYCLWGLMHDASEAYLADLAAPVKRFIDGYRKLEENLMLIEFLAEVIDKRAAS